MAHFNLFSSGSVESIFQSTANKCFFCCCFLFLLTVDILLCTPNTVFPVAHKHTWRHRHWSHLSQTVAQHSAESRHKDPLHTITSRTHDCQNTPQAISFSAAHVHTVRAPGPEDKACPSNLPVSKDAPAQSQHTHSAGVSQPTTTVCALGSILYSIPQSNGDNKNYSGDNTYRIRISPKYF